MHNFAQFCQIAAKLGAASRPRIDPGAAHQTPLEGAAFATHERNRANIPQQIPAHLAISLTPLRLYLI
jgi:hypothetical protein